MKPKNEPNADVKPTTKEEPINARSNDSPTTVVKKADAGDLGSPVPKIVHLAAESNTANAIEAAVNRKDETKAADSLPAVVDPVLSSEKSTGSVLEKLDSSAGTDAKFPSAVQSPVVDEMPALASSIVATPPAISRPGTPATAASGTPESSAVRPKTLRITPWMSQKPETTPVSAVVEKGVTLPSAPGKQRSRQPSISSLSRSRPSTPAVSDNLYSNDVSRASSPPIVGSAPEKSKSKNQIRRERKSKVKDATETNSDGPPTPVERKFEEAPAIVARQTKKKRKTQDRSTVDDDSSPAIAAENVEPKMPGVLEPSKATKQQSTKDANAAGNSEQMHAHNLALEVELKKEAATPSAKTEDMVVSNATPKEPYTLNQLLIESGKANDPEAFKILLNEHISNIQTLFSQLFDSKQLDQSSALFNLPPLTSYRLPPDSRRGADYLDGNGYTMSSPFAEVYLTSKEKRGVQQGSPVRISDPTRPNDLLKRTLVTKNGRVYRHLSQEEEDRILALENRREEDERMYGEVGTKEMLRVDEADLLNIEGGLEELLKHGNTHGVSWVTDESENIDGDMDEEDDANYDTGDNEPGELAGLAGGWQAADALRAGPAAASAKEQVAARQHAQKKSLNLRAMDTEKLQKTIRETQMEMEQARKEMEAVEKKWVKKGKEAAKWRETILKGKIAVGSE